jgi:hypothetical protein
MGATDSEASVGDIHGPICERGKIREEVIGDSQSVMRYLSRGGDACGQPHVESLALHPCERIGNGASARRRLTGQDEASIETAGQGDSDWRVGWASQVARSK